MGTELIIERPNWSFDTPVRDDPAFPDAAPVGTLPAVVEGERPPFSREDLALIDSSGVDLGTDATEVSAAPGKGATALSLDALNKEIADIEKIMRDDRALYNKKHAARYGELLKARDEAQEAAREEAQLKATIDAVLGGVVDGAAFEAGFDEAFAALSPEGQALVRHELGTTPWEPAQPASPEAVAAFASTDEEAAKLVHEWGKAAPRKVAMVKARVERFLSGDTDALGRWVDGLAPKDAAALWRELAGR